MKLRRFFAADEGSGTGGDEPQALTLDTAVAALRERRDEQAKEFEKQQKKPEAQPAKAEARTPDIPAKTDQENPDAADNGAPDVSEKSDDEKLAAELTKEQTPVQGEMPSGWGEADKDLWASLTPEAQQRLVTREKQRDAGIRKQLAATDAAKKEAEAQIAQAKAERQQLGPALQSTQQFIVQQLVEQFPDVDPRDPNSIMKLALEHPERKVVFDSLAQRLAQTMNMAKEHEAKIQAEKDEEFKKFSESRVSRLTELDQSLSDAKNAEAFETAVVGYLIKDNPYGPIDAERIKHYTAEELLFVRDAMKYRKAMASLQSKPKAEVPKVVKAGASGDGGKSDEVAALEKRAKTKGLTLDEAVKLRKLRLAAG